MKPRWRSRGRPSTRCASEDVGTSELRRHRLASVGFDARKSHLSTTVIDALFAHDLISSDEKNAGEDYALDGWRVSLCFKSPRLKQINYKWFEEDRIVTSFWDQDRLSIFPESFERKILYRWKHLTKYLIQTGPDIKPALDRVILYQETTLQEIKAHPNFQKLLHQGFHALHTFYREF